MWLFPWLSYLTIAAMVVVIVAMAVLPDTRSSFLLSLITVVVILVAYEIRVRRGRRRDGRPTGGGSGARWRGSTPAREPGAVASTFGISTAGVDREPPGRTGRN